MNKRVHEKQKWNSYYSDLPLLEEDAETARFNQEFVDCIRNLLPDGGKTLEAGSGAGWQSAALRRQGLFETALLDFSASALSYAKKVFEQQRLSGQFIEGDLVERGVAEYDLVFNAGVLEHYSFEDQVVLLRGMASRTKRYVLVLVPNRQCYWYWIWRYSRSAQATWLWGKEIPVKDMAKLFQAAGVRLLGQRYLGSAWTESFISDCTKADPNLREDALAVHRSSIIPAAEKAYLIAGLGSLCDDDSVPRSWDHEGCSEDNTVSLLTSALSDALASRNAPSRRNGETPADLEALLVERNQFMQDKHALINTLDSITSQTAHLHEERRSLTQTIRELEQTAQSLRDELDLHRNSAAVSKRLLEELDRRTNDERRDFQMAATQASASHKDVVSALDNFRNVSHQYTLDLSACQERLTAVEVERDSIQARVDQITASNTLLEQQLARDNTERVVTARLLEEFDKHIAVLKGSADSNTHLLEVLVEHSTLQEDLLLAREDQAKTNRSLERLQSELVTERENAQTLTADLEICRHSLNESEKRLAEKALEIAAEQARSEQARKIYEALKKSIVAAGIAFESAMQSTLIGVRGQRAWRVMLAIRKAYSLWTRLGLRGKLRSLRVPLDLVTGAPHVFAEFDIKFPSLWNYWSDAATQQNEVVSTVGAAPGQLDIIILPVFDFEFRFQRPQQIAAHLARRGHRVFWVSPSRFLGLNSKHTFEQILLRDNLYEIRLSGEALNIYTDSLTQGRAEEIAGYLNNLYRDSGLSEVVLLVQFPFWRQVALNFREYTGARLVYDCMDDWRNWTAEPRISTFSLQEELALARESDVLVATSAKLHTRLESEAGHPALRLRNGVDFDFFQNYTEISSLHSTQRPIVGYYGAIADWVNVKLMVDVAELRPQYSFVIIGEVHSGDVSRLKRLPNVQLLGEKNYYTIPSYLHTFDVCILPFMHSSLTTAVDPVKVYEYLSQGKPIIATPLPEVLDHGDLIYFAETAVDFASQIDNALAESEEKQARRIKYAEENSWGCRTESLTTAIANTYPIVSILAVSYNSREYLGPFLDSIRRNTAYPRYELILVDNDSTDGSQTLLKEYEPLFSQLRILRSTKNLGFAAGNNVAASHACGEFLVMLNVDTVVTWGWLGRLLRPLQRDPRIGMSAPVTNFSGNETRIHTNYRTLSQMEHFARDRSSAEFNKTLDLDMAPLLCAAIPLRVWKEVGELDAAFGAGMFEDDDYSVRVKNAGYRIVVVEDCFVHHFGNGSFGKLPSVDALKLFERNRLYFESKWKTSWQGHRMRDGVLPLSEYRQSSLMEFLGSMPSETLQVATLKLLRMLPERTTVGARINPQPDGSSALVVECENATPGTVIRFGGELLQTAYGHAGLLSAILPERFNLVPREILVSLVNDLGESKSMVFVVDQST